MKLEKWLRNNLVSGKFPLRAQHTSYLQLSMSFSQWSELLPHGSQRQEGNPSDPKSSGAAFPGEHSSQLSDVDIRDALEVGL